MSSRPHPRKPRFDSTQAIIETVQVATKPVEIPSFIELTEGAKLFWDVVVRARAVSEWSDADLTLAADLCECMADMAENAVELRNEGYVLENHRGQPVQNPRNQVMEVLTRRKVAIFRILQIHARALGGENREVVKQREQEREIAATTGRAFSEDEDDLLARPVH